MLRTYSLFIHHETDGSRFEPFLGKDEAAAFERAQEHLACDAGIARVDVHFGDDHLFSLGRGGS